VGKETKKPPGVRGRASWAVGSIAGVEIEQPSDQGGLTTEVICTVV
jgi:hypothetical protein